jgi:hypothetical protein
LCLKKPQKFVLRIRIRKDWNFSRSENFDLDLDSDPTILYDAETLAGNFGIRI